MRVLNAITGPLSHSPAETIAKRGLSIYSFVPKLASIDFL
jgi:hypothetical protein